MKEIKFFTEFDFIDIPKPAIKYIPEWYKKTQSDISIDNGGSIYRADDKRTFKTCIPFFDSMTSGYIHELWSDIQVIKNTSITWNENLPTEVFSTKPLGSIGQMEIPAGYSNDIYSFKHNLYIKTPPGYSLLITQPFNRTDLPFYALSGIVDCDINPMFPGAYPVFLKKDFDGIIKRGTPMLQIIPFKRDSWISKKDKDAAEKGSLAQRIASTVFDSWYKKTSWTRKDYR